MVERVDLLVVFVEEGQLADARHFLEVRIGALCLLPLSAGDAIAEDTGVDGGGTNYICVQSVIGAVEAVSEP